MTVNVKYVGHAALINVLVRPDSSLHKHCRWHVDGVELLEWTLRCVECFFRRYALTTLALTDLVPTELCLATLPGNCRTWPAALSRLLPPTDHYMGLSDVVPDWRHRLNPCYLHEQTVLIACRGSYFRVYSSALAVERRSLLVWMPI